MKELYADSAEFQNKTKQNPIERLQKRWSIVLYFCGIGGIFIGACGLLLSALEYFKFVNKTARLIEIGTGLIVLAFPLIMFGAHALDKIGELKRKKAESD